MNIFFTCDMWHFDDQARSTMPHSKASSHTRSVAAELGSVVGTRPYLQWISGAMYSSDGTKKSRLKVKTR